MITSENLSDLAKALCKAQAAILGAQKDSKNPHFNSKFSSLASVWEACREPLTSNGLSVVQALGSHENKVSCTTMLMHESGQFIRTEFAMTPQQNTPQAAGSCATYLRRYSLQSLVGVCPDDDDGQLATQKGTSYASPAQAAAPMVTKTVVKSPVVKPTTKDVSDTAAPATFSKGDSSQIRILGSFLTAKNKMSLFDTLADRLVGKPFTQSNINKEWSTIDPESFSPPYEDGV